ncbi:trans-resveratrol di-O-methyltransferase-like [Papaver somniferum]|uniref:trans-resveratrol di-O-methyltransferase-like n=1 Tax=Papaver somniferum TaxID=3469 RepID=UPI000E6FEC09|nr:trans-resveratrol di-O-methyltransferase-like [Papaver somniferum]
MSLKCVVELGIPDIIHSHGKPMHLSNLFDALSLPSVRIDPLNRLMRFMIHSGFFATQSLGENQEQEGYLLTPTLRILVKANPKTMSSVVLSMVDPILVLSFQSLHTWFQGSESSPFVAAHGMSLWNLLEQNPESGKNFHDSMANDSCVLMSVILKEGKEVFDNLKSLVDVGGGTGTTAHAVVGAFPHLICIVLDLPNVVANLQGTANVVFIGGDMFESIPHADAVRTVLPFWSALGEFILHDWSDKDCVRILQRCRAAIPSREEGGKVIIIDAVIEEDKNKQEDSITETQLLMDIAVMAIYNSKERTENFSSTQVLLTTNNSCPGV